jgi:hypothetical protein
MENGVVKHLQLAQFANELDVAEHLTLGQKPRLLFVTYD